MTNGTMSVRTVDPSLFVNVFGSEAKYGIGVDQTGKEVIVVPEGTIYIVQGTEAGLDLAPIHKVKTTSLTCKCWNHIEYCLVGNIWVPVGSC